MKDEEMKDERRRDNRQIDNRFKISRMSKVQSHKVIKLTRFQ